MGEDVNTMLIVNLLSGTEYSVKVIASYSAGSSEALSGRAKTRESKIQMLMLPPGDLFVFYTEYS